MPTFASGVQIPIWWACTLMAITKSVILLAFLSLSPLCFQQTSVEGTEFDMFVLAVYRTAHVCAKFKAAGCCFANECCRFKPHPEYTIHSFWPNYFNHTWPRCCGDSSLNESQVSTLVPALVEYWPPLECGPSNHLSHCGGIKKSLLWEHEWEVHGTCSTPVINDQYTYFSKGLELYHKYNLSQILTSNGFRGSDVLKYSLNDIITTVQNAVGASPLVECENGSLMQIRLCFGKDLTPRTCGPVSSISCPDYIRLATTGGQGGGNAAMIRMAKE